MTPEKLRELLKMAFFMGFGCSGEGFNSEWPFGDHNEKPEDDASLKEYAEEAVGRIMEENPIEPGPNVCGLCQCTLSACECGE